MNFNIEKEEEEEKCGYEPSEKEKEILKIKDQAPPTYDEILR